MPNWCMNHVNIEHDDPAQIQRLQFEFNRGTFLNAIAPQPDVIPPLTVELESLPDWYNWRLQNWGCKWDVGPDGQSDLLTPNMLSLSFDSPWAPPIIAYQKLVDQGFKVHAYYHEMGMCFMGEFQDGEDDYLEYSGPDDIPDDWFDVWNMGEYFAMMEEEDC